MFLWTIVNGTIHSAAISSFLTIHCFSQTKHLHNKTLRTITQCFIAIFVAISHCPEGQKLKA